MRQRPGTCADFLPLVLWQDAIGENAPLQVNYHHDFYSLYIVRSGKGTHVIDGTAYGIARGDVYVMGPKMTHHFERGDKLRADTFHFTLDVFDEATQTALRAAPGFHALLVSPGEGSVRRTSQRWLHLTPAAHHEIAHHIREIKAEWGTGNVLGASVTRGLFLRLLMALSRYAAPGLSATAPPPPARRFADNEAAIAQAVRYMDEHFASPLSIENLAARVFLSPDRFTHLFGQVVGRTPRDYLRHLRVEQAKTLLTTTSANLDEVARLSGLGGAAYLVRVMQKETGQTPRRFRLSLAPRPASDKRDGAGGLNS